MNGPKHYREAERLLAGAQGMADTGNGISLRNGREVAATEVCLRLAQVHATLALAAATAYPATRDWDGESRATDAFAWTEATS